MKPIQLCPIVPNRFHVPHDFLFVEAAWWQDDDYRSKMIYQAKEINWIVVDNSTHLLGRPLSIHQQIKILRELGEAQEGPWSHPRSRVLVLPDVKGEETLTRDAVSDACRQLTAAESQVFWKNTECKIMIVPQAKCPAPVPTSGILDRYLVQQSYQKMLESLLSITASHGITSDRLVLGLPYQFGSPEGDESEWASNRVAFVCDNLPQYPELRTVHLLGLSDPRELQGYASALRAGMTIYNDSGQAYLHAWTGNRLRKMGPSLSIPKSAARYRAGLPMPTVPRLNHLGDQRRFSGTDFLDVFYDNLNYITECAAVSYTNALDPTRGE